VTLVDTSVWIDHFREGVPALAEALYHQRVLAHPFVTGELACGNLQNRTEILDLLARLPQATVASQHEALRLIEARSLMARGIGYVDVHLLASTLLHDGATLWTRDRRLRQVAAELSLLRGAE